MMKGLESVQNLARGGGWCIKDLTLPLPHHSLRDILPGMMGLSPFRDLSNLVTRENGFEGYFKLRKKGLGGERAGRKH